MTRFFQQLGLAGAVSLAVAMGLRAADLPSEILQESGWTGGVAVCVGYDEAGRISPLPGFRTQLLESDPQSVASVRTRVIAEKVGDKVTVKRWKHGFLPYADNLVNVIIYRHGAGDEEAAAVKEEIRRVLVPGGVAAIRRQGNDGLIAAFSNPLKELENGWVLFTEPTRTDTDDWSHWLHGADGNPVAADQVSGPPRRIQWAATPLRCRSHDVGLSMTGMVTGGGRLFYIADDGPVGMQDHQTHGLETWMLFCRDAYNGVLLWKQPVKDWGMRAWSPAESKADGYGPWSINPRMVHKRLVVEGNRLFVTLGFKAGVSVLDATDGSYLRTLPETEFTSEMVVVANRAYLVVDQAAEEARAYTTAPRNRIVAVDTATGKKLWQSEETAGIKDNRTRGFDGALSRLHVTAADGKVFYVDKTEVVALDAQSGQDCWRFKRPSVISLRNTEDTHVVNNEWDLCNMLYSDGILYFWQGIHPNTRQSYYSMTIHAISAADGKTIWRKDCCSSTFLSELPSVYRAQGLIWVEDASGSRQDSKNLLLGMDPKTGEVLKRYDMSAIFRTTHHHRCYPNKATENYLIFGRNGVEYVDLRTGELSINRWLRGVCQYGILPANGLLYRPADPCACFPSARHNGYYAYSSGSTANDHCPPASERLQKGPAFGEDLRSLPASPEDWSVYRHDAMRSGASPTAVAGKLSEQWTSAFGEPISAPTVGSDRVYVATQQSRQVVSLDAATGKVLWSVAVEGCIDTPPTLAAESVFFGTRDGYVYCLRQTDGALRWRFHAAPAYRQIISFEDLESAWPIHGSVVVQNGKVMFFAGRCSYVDGGLFFYQLDAQTGAVSQSKVIERDPHQDGLAGATGTASDLLICDGRSLNLRNISLDIGDFSVTHYDWRIAGGNRSFPGALFSATNGFLDEGMYDRDAWSFNGVMGKMISFNDEAVYLTQWLNQKDTWHKLIFDLAKHHYAVRSVAREASKAPATPKLQRRGKGLPRGRGAPADLWQSQVPIRPAAMVLTRDVLFACGVLFFQDAPHLRESIAGEQGGVLVALDERTGQLLSQTELPAAPVWDGMAAARGTLFITKKDGSVSCYR